MQTVADTPPRTRLVLQSATVVAVAAAVGAGFGSLMALIKGSGDDIRYDIGNLIVLWLLLPGVIGVRARRVGHALVLGTLCAALAILSFYFVFDNLSFGPWRYVGGNRSFFLSVGSAAGGLFATLTYAMTRLRSTLQAVPWSLACIAEPLVVPVFGRGNSQRSLVYVVEIACGLAVFLYSVGATVRRKREAPNESRAVDP